MTTRIIRISLLLALVACGAGEDRPEAAGAAPGRPAADPPAATDIPATPGATPAAAPTDTAEAAPDPPDAAARPWTAQRTVAERTVEGAALLRDVRHARHSDFDRVVLDFGEDPVPTFHIEYIDRPVRQCGSGHEVPMAGDGWLQIEVTPAHAHTQEGRPTVELRSRQPGLPSIRQLEMTCDFEAHVEWVVGVASPTRYRAFELRSPNRLVVDIRHPGGS